MTFIRGILLGSVTSIVAVVGSHAADLPTKKSAPAEYVKICNVGGMAGFVIPGSDTCLKIGGYITGQVAAGNTSKSYKWSSSGAQGAALTATSGNLNPQFGYETRANISLDARQNTPYGVLRGYVEMQFDNSNGFDGATTGAGNGSYINVAYIQWAGITAGKAPSFFSFFGGGEAWNNIFSADQQGFNQPDLFAYTATFGGGFSATVAAQSPGTNGLSGGGTNQNVNNYFMGPANTTNFGMKAPDIVANIRLDQGWGAAQLSGVAHNVHVFDASGNSLDTWGFAINGGVKVLIPTLGSGDNVQAQVTYSKNAMWYSGIPDAQNGENGAVNGNGLAMSVGDTYSRGNGQWATPTTWTATLLAEHYFSQEFSIDPEVSYVNLQWSNSGGQLSNNTQSWIGGAVAHWDPVPLLDFELDVLYQNTHQSTPGLFAKMGTINNVVSAFPNTADGVAGRFKVTRSF
jgi:hypothetical protein